MKKVSANVFAIPIRVNVNSKGKSDRWAQIKCAQTGKILHTGRVNYIRRVARVRYNVNAQI